MKKIFLLSVCFFIVINLSAQNKPKDFSHHISLSDASSLYGSVVNLFIPDGSGIVIKANASPIPHLSYTYMFTRNFGAGLTGTYQFFNFELSVLEMKIHRINPSVHADYYIVTNDNIDLYGGGRLGFSIWSGNISFADLRSYISSLIPSFATNLVPQSFYDKIMPSDKKFFKTFTSYQVYLGTNIYITPNFAIKGELAIGSPYWGLLGLNVRL